LKPDETKRAIVVAVIILFTAGLMWFLLTMGKDKPPPRRGYAGGGEIPENWEPDYTTTELYWVIDGITDTASEISAAFAKFNVLNDNQKKVLRPYPD